jgi:hypothetical protein
MLYGVTIGHDSESFCISFLDGLVKKAQNTIFFTRVFSDLYLFPEVAKTPEKG